MQTHSKFIYINILIYIKLYIKVNKHDIFQ